MQREKGGSRPQSAMGGGGGFFFGGGGGPTPHCCEREKKEEARCSVALVSARGKKEKGRLER